jgi:excisionase family DNA binding protein
VSTYRRAATAQLTLLDERGWNAREEHYTADDILTAGELAALLHMPLSTIRQLARTDVIPGKKIGRRRVFLRPEIERWLRERD